MDPILNRNAPRFLPIAKPCLGQREVEAVAAAVESGWISSGPLVEKFEAEFAAAHGKKFGVACNSGTTALHLAMALLGVGPTSTVYLPTMTMIACANAVLYCGGKLRLVESEPITGNMDFRKMASPGCIDTSQTILCPHLYGMPATGIRKYNGLQVIEDCAESHYATYPDGCSIGSHGGLAVFSFYANKIVTAGEGGVVLTNSEAWATSLRSLRSHAFTPGEHFNHQSLAYGYRMTEMQAAIGLAQHERRVEFVEKRREIYDRYCSNLSSVGNWLTWPRRPSGSVDWMFPLQIVPEVWEDEGFPMPPLEGYGDYVTVRDHIRHRLAEAGIETRTYFKPLHRQQHVAATLENRSSFPVADSLYENGICLPIYFEMEVDDVDYICEQLIACGQRPRPTDGDGGREFVRNGIDAT
jgi:perosamine synthetase